MAHIVNPVKVTEASDLFYAQPITFKSMQCAKEFSLEKIDVTLYAVNFYEDDSVVPEYFSKCDYLKRSILDFGEFSAKKKLPLISDILYSLKDVKVDYIVYTNVDIGLLPYFYEYVLNKIQSGSDTLVINRRIISNDPHRTMAEMFSEIGSPHIGYDCFVFKKELIEKFNLGNVCIGANWIGRAFISNLIAHSKKVEIIKDKHLTFHLGQDTVWMSKKYLDYDLHNRNELKKIISDLLNECKTDYSRNELIEINNYLDDWYKSKDHVSKNGISLTLYRRIISFLSSFKNFFS